MTVIPDSHTPADISLAARNLRFDLSDALAGDWHGDDGFKTALFNALSITFPSGEQFFVESVRHFLPQLKDEKLKEHAAGFVQQEYVHRREHQRYNETLCALHGWNLDELEARYLKRIEKVKQMLPPLGQLGATVCLEHLTAIMASGLLTDPRWLEGANANMAALWRWHAIEEGEHKSVAFDVYRAVGGSAEQLHRLMKIIFPQFAMRICLTIRQMRSLDNKTWLSYRFWRDGYRFLYGPDGIFQPLKPQYRDFFRAGFHPWQHDNRELLQTWSDELAVLGNAELARG